MTSSVVVLTSLLLTATTTRVLSRDAVEYQLLEESPAGTLVGDLLHDVPGLAGLSQRLQFSISRSSALEGQLTVGELDGRVRTGQVRLDREAACPGPRDRCTIELDVAVQPLSVFRLISVAVSVVDVNDNSPVFATSRYRCSKVYDVFCRFFSRGSAA